MAQALGRGLDLLQPQPWVQTVYFIPASRVSSL